MLKNIQAIVLAAGKSTRFNTGNTKLIEKLCGQPMIVYTTRMLESLSIPTTLVVGYQKDAVMHAVEQKHSTITFVEQTEQLGTGHALSCTQHLWSADYILIMNGDMPLTPPSLIQELFKKHTENNAVVSFVTAHNGDPSGKDYGRIVQTGNQIEIIEAKNFSGDIADHCCVNAGIYLFTRSFIEEYCSLIKKNPVAQEFYITDLIKKASDAGLRITTTQAPFDQIRGINTFEELWAAEHIKQSELIKYWMGQGVRFASPQTVHIGLDVVIGRGTKIGSCCHVIGTTEIGEKCHIQPFSIIRNSKLSNDVTVHPHTIVENSTIASQAQVGPFAHINQQTVIGERSVIGNFVETKNTTIGADTKAKHLTYLGNAQIGSHVNIGAGTITCNYDGQKKQVTTIEDHVFIGSNNSLVAPLTIQKGAYTAAGSTITDSVPAYALAIGRARQINKEKYRQKHEATVPSDTDASSSDKLSFGAARKVTSDPIIQ